jgi:hypothetical protein
MSQTHPEQMPAAAVAHAPVARSRTFLLRIGAVAVLALLATVIVWLVVRDAGPSSGGGSKLDATAVSAGELADLAASLGHPVFWAGEQDGMTYELSRGSGGAVFIRYLPSGVEVGSGKPFPTIATYPFPGAYAAVEEVAEKKGAVTARLADGGLAVSSAEHPASVHVAYPGVDYQVEVYDPTGGAAMALVTAGKLVALGDLKAGSPLASSGAKAVTPAGLETLARALGRPVYWVGPKQGATYELTQTASGDVFVRYLPEGAEIGTPEQYLTVATYPFPGAFGAIEARAKEEGATTFELEGGGLAVLGATNPKSIHLAFPGSDYEIEVFDPDPGVVRTLVSTGQVSAVG